MSRRGREDSISTGATIGMVAGGQLGRMTALAAASLGYEVHVYHDKGGSPTAQVAARETVAAFDDEEALEAFARSVDVITYEWESLPVEALRVLERHCLVRPSVELLEVAQDRGREKSFVNEAGLETAPWVEVRTLGELERAVEEVRRPCMLKTCRFGYDGKGQVKICDETLLSEAWKEVGEVRCVVEGFVDFQAELSVIVARNPSGQVAVYDPVENHHVEQVLETTIAVAPFANEVLRRAVDVAVTLAEAIALEGVLGVELFLTRDGRLLVNEIAPRPHNSGHWTIDACYTSQFEQHVRAICNLPLGSPVRHHDAMMQNLLGPLEPRLSEALLEPMAKIHVYGKKELRPGRKTGHITRLLPLSPIKAAILK